MGNEEKRISSDKASVTRLVEICYKFGVEDVVFSPGSRNAPLVVSFVESDQFSTYCIPDERSAAFYALGMSLQTKRTTIICCTSGSAVLNYAPAISEAYYQGIPLLVLTADRPSEWIDQGIGQCIRQNDIYANYIKASHTLIQEAKAQEDIERNDKIVSTALSESQSGFKGPVHINIPLAEPLYGTMTLADGDLLDINANIHESRPQEHDVLSNELKEIWSSSERKLVLFGLSDPNKELESLLKELVFSDQIVLLTETGSNCYVEDAVQTIDRLITGVTDASLYQPDLVISIGGPVVSKKIKSLFLNNKPRNHWHISLDSAKDTFKSLTHYLHSDANAIIKALKEIKSVNTVDFQRTWIETNKRLKSAHESYMSHCAYSDFKVFARVLNQIPDNAVLHMGNSTVVRYVQLFDQNPEIEYYGNRGVSGIDGCTSTALGFTIKSDRLNICITGDIAFHYDVNAFWNPHLPKGFRLLIINNNGGGIFRIIPGPGSTRQLKQYFESYQETNASKLAEHYGLSYYTAHDEDTLTQELSHFFDNSPDIKVLEIFTPREVNDKVLAGYFEAIHSVN